MKINDNNKTFRLIKGAHVEMPTSTGMFSLIPFQEVDNGLEHIVLIKGDIYEVDVVLTRIHSACATGDLFGSLRCDCGDQLKKSMQLIEENGSGVIIYLQQEGRGIGLMNKIKAYKLQENGMDTVDANIHLGFAPDERDYTIGAAILKALFITNVKLLTNNPLKVDGLEKNGITVSERLEIIIESNRYNHKYLFTKAQRMGHILENYK
ncbi:MAG: GTP cyclohydrolase II [Marinilabiliaceae bacterium]|nr:GTP cyclohydrolase II [Marinilabiliaceae bacterium]